MKISLLVLATVFSLGAWAGGDVPEDKGGGNPADPMRFWEKVPASALPKLIPEGKLKDLRSSLEQQRQSCEEAKTGQFTKCHRETSHVTFDCDEAALEHLIRLTKETKDWPTFYKRAKAEFDFYKYKAADNSGNVTMTGYNAPSFVGATKQDSKHKYPVYDRPPDLVSVPGENGVVEWKKKLPNGTLVPYDDRKAIDGDGILKGKGLEVAWFEDPSDVMRLQIEGSGILKLDDGSEKELVLNYAGKNGLPYKSVFTYLKAKGVDKKYLSFPGLKQYFKDFPEDMWPTLFSNPAYVFFSLSAEPPCGTARVWLTPGHTVASDPLHLPLGAIALINGDRPLEKGGTTKFSRFTVAQDTGSGIRQGHVDVYWGTDDYAMLASNSMKSTGIMFLVKSRERAAKLTPQPAEAKRGYDSAK